MSRAPRFRMSAVSRSLVCCLSAAGFATAGLSESFESGLPESIASQGGGLTLSSEHIQDGKQSLRWEFKEGDAFVIHTGPLGNVNVWTGYGGYSRSSLILPVYLPTLGKGHLLVEIRAGEETAATITVPLVHVGWQKLVYHYSWQSQMHWTRRILEGKLDNLRISAHGIEQPSHAFFDAILYNTPRDFRDARAAVTQAWSPVAHEFTKNPAPSPADLEKLEILARSLVPAQEPKAPAERWRKRADQLRQQIQQNRWRLGNPVTGNLSPYFDFLNGIADDWCRCTDPDLQQELADAFHAVNDWLQEQGLVVNGALGKADNYIGRTYVDAITKMLDPLERHGNLETSIHYLKWSYNYDDQVFGPNHQESMDYFHNEALRLLRIALSHRDAVTRWHHVSAFRETLGRQLVASIKPDGAIFHHGFHYFAYGSMGMNSVSGTLAVMSQAGLPVAREGLDMVKRALMQMRWYSGGTTLWSLSGRAAHGTMQPPAGAFLNAAKAYVPYLEGSWDPELTAAYLRFDPNAAKKPEFAGFRPEASPNGFNAMPWAALAMHRGADWLVGIKGFSKYAASGESYANANRHGLYMSMGQMEILSHPQPFPTAIGSGTRPNEGYNWCAMEGATTIHTPLDRIANGNGTRIPLNPETFVGAVSNGRNGLFAMRLTNTFTGHIMRDRPQGSPAPEPLRALKSWFCFGNRVICLGSDISTKNVPFPVRTNLFQKFLTEDHAVTKAGGESLSFSGQPVSRGFMDRTTLIDPYGNAYFVAPGNKTHLAIGTQKSRDPDDTRDTTGTYATAWIEHGENPEAGGYEYAVLIQPDGATVELFDPNEAYAVLRKDSSAHIVRDQVTKTTAFAVFDTRQPLPESTPLVSASQPCLVMFEEHDDHLLLSVCDPDLRAGAREPASLTLNLRGRFRTADGATPSADSRTAITCTLHGAESQALRLERLRP
jgi:chondroitin-sulfate-ABC endolyase/exolyase